MPSDEESLLRSATQGDQDALTQLLEQYGPVVRQGLAGQIPAQYRSLLTDEDVMQQTYLDAFLDICRFEPRGDGSFLAWLGTLARRNLLDAIRMLDSPKRGGDRVRVDGRSPDDSCIELFDYLSGSITSPSAHAARTEAKSSLLRAIQTLPAASQQVITLYDLECRPLQEVAAAVGRTVGAVLMLRARAHNRLRSTLGRASDYLSTTA